MQEKKKKKKTTIIRTTQPRATRLNRAKVWLPTYNGKNIIKGYAKKHRVDLLCAIAELRLLGIEIKAEYEQAVRTTIEQRVEQNRLKKEAKEAYAGFDGINEHQDWDFAFIAGYTSGGAPYGIRHEEIFDEETED